MAPRPHSAPAGAGSGGRRPPHLEDNFKYVPPNHVVNTQPKPDRNKLYFRTTAVEELPERGTPEGVAKDNFLDVHMIGQRSSRFMQYQRSRAPLQDRSCTSYSREFFDPGVGDKLAVGNRELARSIGAGNRAARPQSAGELNGATTYTEAYRPPTAEEARRAKPKTAKINLAASKSVPKGGESLERTSMAHAQFTTPVGKPAERVLPPKPMLELPVASCPIVSSYRKAFRNPGTLHRSASAPGSEAARARSRRGSSRRHRQSGSCAHSAKEGACSQAGDGGSAAPHRRK